MQQMQAAVRDVPLQLNQMMMDLSTGNIDVGVVDRESAAMRNEVRWVGIRLSMAMIAGAMGVGGAGTSSALHGHRGTRCGCSPHDRNHVHRGLHCGLHVSLVMHTLFAARIHPREWLRRWMAVIRFFLPGARATESVCVRAGRLLCSLGPCGSFPRRICVAECTKERVNTWPMRVA